MEEPSPTHADGYHLTRWGVYKAEIRFCSIAMSVKNALNSGSVVAGKHSGEQVLGCACFVEDEFARKPRGLTFERNIAPCLLLGRGERCRRTNVAPVSPGPLLFCRIRRLVRSTSAVLIGQGSDGFVE